MNKPLLKFVKIRILVLGVSLWLFRCSMFFNTVCYLVLCSVKAVNRSLHLCIWKITLYYIFLFLIFFFFFLLKNNKHLTNDQ